MATVFAPLHAPMDQALGLVMRRCGVRGSEVAPLQGRDLDWSQHAWRIEQGTGRQDRQVDLSADAVESWRACLQQRPSGVPAEAVCWHPKRPPRTLSVQALQKTMAR
jgi:site-specific recombinase XerC